MKCVYDKVFVCTEHSINRNSSSAVPGLWPHMTRWSTHLLQEFIWEVFNHYIPYSPHLAPSDLHLFLHLKKFLSGQHQRFQNDRGGDECRSGSNPRRYSSMTGSGGSSSKALGCGLDGPGVGGVEIFLHSFVSRLVLGSTQPPIK